MMIATAVVGVYGLSPEFFYLWAISSLVLIGAGTLLTWLWPRIKRLLVACGVASALVPLLFVASFVYISNVCPDWVWDFLCAMI